MVHCVLCNKIIFLLLLGLHCILQNLKGALLDFDIDGLSLGLAINV